MFSARKEQVGDLLRVLDSVERSYRKRVAAGKPEDRVELVVGDGLVRGPAAAEFFVDAGDKLRVWEGDRVSPCAVLRERWRRTGCSEPGEEGDGRESR